MGSFCDSDEEDCNQQDSTSKAAAKDAGTAARKPKADAAANPGPSPVNDGGVSPNVPVEGGAQSESACKNETTANACFNCCDSFKQ